MQKVKGIYRHLITIVLLIIFTTYYVNANFFYHCHTINGVTIVHSHIHDGNHEQTGTHSRSELTLIGALSFFISLVAIIYCVLFLFKALISVIRCSTIEKLYTNNTGYILLRAPPFLF